MNITLGKMQGKVLTTSLSFKETTSGINQLEQFLENCIDILGISDASEGIVSSCALEFYDLLSYLNQKEDVDMKLSIQHEGLTLTFLLEQVMYYSVKEYISNNSEDEKVMKITLLSEDIEFNEDESSINMLFETKSNFGNISKSRFDQLKEYHLSDKFKVQIFYDSNKKH